MQNPMINIVNVFKRVVATSEFTFIKRIYCISQNLENGRNVGNQANNLNKMRVRRSPKTEERENLSHCNSAFLNFAKFKQRGCPPPKFCTLSRPLKLRYCTKGPGTGVF